MIVRFQRLHPNAGIPTKAHPTDAGFDLTAVSRTYDDFGNIVYGTGIAVEIPKGYVGLVFPRSSICKYDIALTNAVGVIDSCYRGEIMAKFKLTSGASRPDIYNEGDRIAQLIIIPYPEVNFEESNALTETERGAGGYGSTGR